MSERQIAYDDIYFEGTLIYSFLVEVKMSQFRKKDEGFFF